MKKSAKSAAIPMTETNFRVAVLLEKILHRYFVELEYCFRKVCTDKFIGVTRHGLQFYIHYLREDGTTYTKQTPIGDDLYDLTADSKIFYILLNPNTTRNKFGKEWDIVLAFNLFDFKKELLEIYGI